MTGTITPDAYEILRLEDAVERRRKVALQASEIGVFEFEPVSQETYWDERVRALWGVSMEEPTNYDLVIKGVHPDDRDLHDAETARVLDPKGTGHMDFSYRIFPLNGEPMRWVRAVANCVFEGDVPIRLVGTVRDVTSEKLQEERNEVLLYELEHRVKNTLSTAIAVMDLSRKGHSSIDTYYDAASDRLRSIALSHDLLRRENWRDVDLMSLVRRESEGFLGPQNDRFHLSGVTLRVPARFVMTLTMVIHELLTNAAKHGALSGKTGQVHVAVTVQDDFAHLRWHEKKGSGLNVPDKEARGFGSVLLMEILPAEMGAQVKRTLTTEGLELSISFPLPQEQPV